MDPKQYADEIVDPTIAEFESEPRSRRRAFLACVAAFHMIDYIADPEKPATRRARYRRKSAAFAAVDRYAHALRR